MTDIARLGAEFDGRSLETAVKILDKLSVEAAAAEVASKKLAQTQTSASAAIARGNAQAASSALKIAQASGNATAAEIKQLRAQSQSAAAAYSAAQALDTQTSAALKAAQANLSLADAAQKVVTSQTLASGGTEAFNNSLRSMGQTAGQQQANMTNMVAQFQDIGVTAAMGMNPMLIALQQGSQMSLVFANAAMQAGGPGGAVRLMGQSLLGLVSPISLVTIGLTAGVAWLIQWAMSSDKAEKQTDRFGHTIKDLTDSTHKYNEAASAQKLASYSLAEITDELNRLSGRYTETLDQQAAAALTVAKSKIQEAQASLIKAEALAIENKQMAKNFQLSSNAMRMGIGEPGARSAAGAAAALSGAFQIAADNSEGEVARLKALVGEAWSAMMFLRIGGPAGKKEPKTPKSGAGRSSGGGGSASEKMGNGLSFAEAFKDDTAAIEELNNAVKKFDDLVKNVGGQNVPQWQMRMDELTAAFDAARPGVADLTAATVDYQNALREIAMGPIQDAIDRQQDLIDKASGVDASIEKLRFQFMQMAYAQSNSTLTTLQLLEALNQFDQKTAELKVAERNEEIRRSYESIGSSVSDAFKGMLTAGRSWRDGMKGIINAVIDQLWQMYVVQQIVGLVSGALGGGGVKVSAASTFASIDAAANVAGAGIAGARAKGGPVEPGKTYLVGEEGAELFTPDRHGQIIPSGQTANAGKAPMVINVDARGATDPAAVRAQVQQGILEAAPAIVAAAEARTITSISRQRLGSNAR